MRKLILILLFVTLLANGLLNAQNLLSFSKNKPELNPNLNFANWNYVESVVNGGLESWSSSTNANNWSEDYTGQTYLHAREATIVQSGTYSAKIYLAGGSGIPSFGRMHQTIYGAAGKYYKYSGYLYQTNADTAGTAYFKLNDVGAGYAPLATKTSGTYGSWESFSGVVGGTVGNLLIQLTLYDTKTQSAYFDNISVQELKSPTGWTSATMTATNYVIKDSGCKLVEVTGETYIQMSDTLSAGYYKLKVTQDWTQGQLWAYNGTTTYDFPQSDGIYAVKIYLPGNKPLVIGCDNNTISTISSLSIK